MYITLLKNPNNSTLRWLNNWSFGKNYKNVILSIPKFTQTMADKCDGLIVNSWEGIAQVEKYYSGIHLYQGKKPSCNSLITHSCFIVNRKTGQRIMLVITCSEAQLFLKQYKVMHTRCILKLLPTRTKHFIPTVDADIRYVTDGTGLQYLESFGKPLFLAIDSETKQEAHVRTKDGKEHVYVGILDLVSVCAVYNIAGEWVFKTIVFPWKTKKDWQSLKEINATDYPKVFQNFLYDVEYFNRWRCPIKNVLWDTEYYMRSISPDFQGAYSLGSLAGQWCETSYFWKELTSFKGEAERDEKQYREYVNYSGLDAHWTAMIALNQMVCYNKFNLFNYVLRSKFTPLCSWFNLQGMEINLETLDRLAIKYGNKKIKGEKLFSKITKGLSVNQSAKILPIFKKMAEVAKHEKITDVGHIKSTDLKAIDGLRVSHPFFGWFIDLMSSTRTADKWLSTFINFKQYRNNGKTYFKYSLNNFKTASMRLASSSSNLWLGGNAQNVNLNLREMWTPPEGYVLCSIDAPSAEAYTTGYLSDETNLIKVLLDPSIDFHKHNASGIFEIDYSDITPPKRKLAKPVGFGYFYVMQGGGLLMTMGVENVRALRDALGLSSSVSLISVCGMTISKITKLYPKIRGTWYYKQLSKIVRTGRLTFNNGYSPILSGNVLRDKREFNSAMSLEPQGLSADINLGGCVNVLLNIIKDDSDDKGIIPILQIHDELISLVPENLLVDEVDEYFKKCFTNATRIKSSGKIMRIPAGIPVYARNGKTLKADELPRGSWTKGLTVSDMVTENYNTLVKDHQLDFNLDDIEYLIK